MSHSLTDPLADVPVETFNRLYVLARGDDALVEEALLDTLTWHRDPGFFNWFANKGHWQVDMVEAAGYIQKRIKQRNDDIEDIKEDDAL